MACLEPAEEREQGTEAAERSLGRAGGAGQDRLVAARQLSGLGLRVHLIEEGVELVAGGSQAPAVGGVGRRAQLGQQAVLLAGAEACDTLDVAADGVDGLARRL